MAAQRKPKPAVAPDSSDQPSLRILKKAQCPTISGKSDLTYNLGCAPNGSIHLRVTENSGGGFFNTDWIALADILRLLKPNAPITAVQLAPLYRQRSANSPGFLAAVLRAEGLIRPKEGKQRVHELCPDWDDRVALLLGDAGKPKPTPAKSTGAKSKAGPTRIGKRKPAAKRA
jgi:hypothetical protein